MQVSASIFKAYDIRGIVPATIDDTFAGRWARLSARPRCEPVNALWPWAVMDD